MEEKPSLELQAATKVPRPRALPRMRKEALEYFILLLVQGYTARRVVAEMSKKFGVRLTDPQVLYGGVLYAAQIDRLREELAQYELSTGLARKSIRIRRLKEVAEAWEQKATGTGENSTPDSKAAGVYLKTLDQIGAEMDGVGKDDETIKEDPWYKLLQSLQQASKNQTLPYLPGPEESEGA